METKEQDKEVGNYDETMEIDVPNTSEIAEEDIGLSGILDTELRTLVRVLF